MFRKNTYIWMLILPLCLAGCDQKKPAAVAQMPSAAVVAAQTESNSLNSLLAPIALFPDSLLAQVLAASTTADAVESASTWLSQNKNLQGAALTQAVDGQNWPPAVKALTAFPDVLSQMALNLPWTRQLGQAYTQDPASVMNTVQMLRQRAAQNGVLKNTPQQQVVVTPCTSACTQKSEPHGAKSVVAPSQTIVIRSAQPGVVYVPAYGPAVYGYPSVVYYPGYQPEPVYSSSDMVATGLISFTAGVAVGALVNDNWGWNNWGMNWHQGVVYHNNVFVNRTVIDRNSTVFNHRGFAPGPVISPHFSSLHNTFSPARSDFTSAHSAVLNGHRITTPQFSPMHNTVNRSTPHMPPARRDGTPAQHHSHFSPQRVMAPGPVRVPHSGLSGENFSHADFQHSLADGHFAARQAGFSGEGHSSFFDHLSDGFAHHRRF